MVWYVYALSNLVRSYIYVGMASNVEKRASHLLILGLTKGADQSTPPPETIFPRQFANA
jgi:hypothetical protein